MKLSHELIEKNTGLMMILIVAVISVGGAVEIIPLFHQRSTTEPAAGLEPYAPLELAGRDIYVREGCYNCHSQMVRPFRAETERNGAYSVHCRSISIEAVAPITAGSGPTARPRTSGQRPEATKRGDSPTRCRCAGCT